MRDVKRVLTAMAVAALATSLSACVSQTTSSGKIASDVRAPVATDQGSLSPDIRQILVAGGLDAANPAGPADIPQKINVAPTEATSGNIVTALAATNHQSSSVNGVWQAPVPASEAKSEMVAHPSGNVKSGDLEEVLPSIGKFAPAPKAVAAGRAVARAAYAPRRTVAAVREPPKSLTVAPKVRRF